ncbi:hypothetical protein Taro_012109 [Colocasia esculenta]|uniref:Uncharacterized protein n=1 Tax=Colocasia esculenta TaxID=4460 RepID=A0A843UC02_COLES|nr:hypothetical protein [Colocasia esculenta]
MARTLSEALIRETCALIRGHPPAFHPRSLHPPSSRLLNLRGRSGRPEKFVQIFEVDLEPEGAGGASAEGAAARREAAARRLEDVIHGIVVRRAAPDWLPFIPGSSYWVPPRARSRGLVELLGRVSSPLTEEAVMSLTTVRGWPCSSHLMGDMSSDVAENCPKEDSLPSEDED